MKYLMKSIVIAATMMVMTMGMATLVSATEPTVTVKENVYDGQQPTVRFYEWTQNNTIVGNDHGLIIPIVVSKPGVVYIYAGNCSIERDAFLEVYTNKSCDDNVSRSIAIKSIDEGASYAETYFKADKAGTYYLKLYSISYDTVYKNSVGLAIYHVATGEKTVQSGKKYMFAAQDYGDSLYYKYKAPSTGYIIMQTAADYSSYVELLNAKKKSISNSEYLSASNKYGVMYAVQKGKTYYIRLKPSTAGQLSYLRVTQKKVKEKSGKKRKKAVSIKAKKKVPGTVQCGEKGDWYKFKLKKSGKLKITVATAEQNYLRLSLYDSKGKQIDSSAYLSTGTKVFTVTNGSRYGIANKGTYYVKIDRYSKKSSGYYELSWK